MIGYGGLGSTGSGGVLGTGRTEVGSILRGF